YTNAIANTIGVIRCLAVDPFDPTFNTVDAGTWSSGIWKTTNLQSGSPVWENIAPALSSTGVQSIIINPVNHDIYCSTGYFVFEGYYNEDGAYGIGIYKYSNNEWSQILTLAPSEFEPIRNIVFHPDDYDKIYALGVNKLWVTTNAGSSWDQMVLPTNALERHSRICINEAYPEQMVVAGHAFIALTLNGGNTWTEETNELLGTGYIYSVAYHPVEETFYVATVGTWGVTQTSNIYKYDAANDAWLLMDSNLSLSGRHYVMGLYIAPDGTIYFGGMQLKRLSPDVSGYIPIDLIYGHVDIRDIIFPNGINDDMILFTNDGGIRGFTNANYSTLHNYCGNLNCLQVPNIGISENNSEHIMFGACDNYVWRKNGSNWIWLAFGDGGNVEISNINANNTYAMSSGGGAGKLRYSRAYSSLILTSVSLSDLGSPIVAHPYNPDIVYYGSSWMRLAKGVYNEGWNFSSISTSPVWCPVYDIAVSSADPNHILYSKYCVDNGEIGYSTDGGISFSYVTSSDLDEISILHIQAILSFIIVFLMLSGLLFHVCLKVKKFTILKTVVCLLQI
ncbi:MAG: hypothetical protein HY738_17260, partial [Bacteroidia bacterium]|nr:hypothetical protein [Bacteroidia bacterium]